MIKFPSSLACVTDTVLNIPKKACYLGKKAMHDTRSTISITMTVNNPTDFRSWYINSTDRGRVPFSISLRLWGALRVAEVQLVQDISGSLDVGYNIVRMEVVYIGERDALIYRTGVTCGDTISCDSELLCE